MRIPSTQAMRALESFARLGSVWQAAEEINLTRSAISHQLRQLERDGLVSRRVTDGRPPQVTYALTSSGISLHAALAPLAEWAAQHQLAIRNSRAAFEAAQAAA